MNCLNKIDDIIKQLYHLDSNLAEDQADVCLYYERRDNVDMLHFEDVCPGIDEARVIIMEAINDLQNAKQSAEEDYIGHGKALRSYKSTD